MTVSEDPGLMDFRKMLITSGELAAFFLGSGLVALFEGNTFAVIGVLFFSFGMLNLIGFLMMGYIEVESWNYERKIKRQMLENAEIVR